MCTACTLCTFCVRCYTVYTVQGPLCDQHANSAMRIPLIADQKGKTKRRMSKTPPPPAPMFLPSSVSTATVLPVCELCSQYHPRHRPISARSLDQRRSICMSGESRRTLRMTSGPFDPGLRCHPSSPHSPSRMVWSPSNRGQGSQLVDQRLLGNQSIRLGPT